MKFTTQNLLGATAALAICGSASAGLVEWQAASAGADYSNAGIASPIVDDIGSFDDTTNGGVTYEFIVNATDDGASSALIGARGTGAGDNGAYKWEQWPDSGTLGATVFGVADIDSGVGHILNTDTHVVFVANGADTAIYVNGALAGTMVGTSLSLSGDVGIGQAHDPGGNFDALTGTIIGVAVYDSALSAQDVSDNFDAYLVPEPGSLALLGLGGLAMLRRRRG